MSKKKDSPKTDTKAECLIFVEQFINSVYPQLVSHFVEPELEETLKEVEAEGPASYQEDLDLESYGLPLTAIGFFYTYIKGTCLFGIGAVINGETVKVEYKWFGASMQDLSLVFTKDETRVELINTLKEQIEQAEI